MVPGLHRLKHYLLCTFCHQFLRNLRVSLNKLVAFVTTCLARISSIFAIPSMRIATNLAVYAEIFRFSSFRFPFWQMSSAILIGSVMQVAFLSTSLCSSTTSITEMVPLPFSLNKVDNRLFRHFHVFSLNSIFNFSRVWAVSSSQILSKMCQVFSAVRNLPFTMFISTRNLWSNYIREYATLLHSSRFLA